MTVGTGDYGMHYHARNAKVIARAQVVSEGKWETLPTTTLPARTPLNAYVETVERRTVDQVASGAVPLRDYPAKLWKDGSGTLYIVDGHTRTAIYYTLDKPMPVRIMDEKSLAELGDDYAGITLGQFSDTATDSEVRAKEVELIPNNGTMARSIISRRHMWLAQRPVVLHPRRARRSML